MNMINQYKTVYNKIDNKILRPISFKDSDELCEFLYHFVFERKLKNKETMLSCYTASGLSYNNKVKDMDFHNKTIIKLYINPVCSFCFYTNNNRSIFMITRPDSTHHYVCILK